MKLWITGSKGFLGAALCVLCKERHVAFVGTSKEEADITNLEHLKKFLEKQRGVTHIINCAAFTDVDGAEKNKEHAALVNALGPKNIGLVAKDIGANVIHISTDYVFDGSLKRPYTELDPCCPAHNVYAKTKWEGEKNLLEVCPSACIIRSSWLFGKGGKNFISSVFQKMQEVSFLKVISDQLGRPTFVEDLASIILELLSHSGIYHFANEGEVSRFEIAQEILKKASELHIPLMCKEIIPTLSEAFPTPAKRPSYSVLNTKKIESLLGKPPREWTQALNEYLCAIKTY
jgi:dTDP-4-dehydrorhamnose reductase